MSAGPSVLILGGTRDGRDLAAALLARCDVSSPARVISSLAGRTEKPIMPPGEVRMGGFGGADGLASYLEREHIDAVIDATHPFAARISANAVRACDRVRVPFVVLDRPSWVPCAGDRWYRAAEYAAAALRARALGTRIFLTVGRQQLAPFAAITDRWFLIRTIDAPSQPLPPRNTVVLARGPFAVGDELALMRAHAIDVVVTKDSGGDATAPKLQAARTLGIPVVVIDRPRPAGTRTVGGIEAAIAWLDSRQSSRGD